MSETINIRMERIERLFQQLRYEIDRGMMEREIDESLGFDWIVPISASIPHGVVYCSFRTRPMLTYMVPSSVNEPRLRIVK